MGIKFSCPHCDRSLHVKANLAGRRGLCPHCGGRLNIPRPGPTAEPAPPAAEWAAGNGQSKASQPPADRPPVGPRVGPAIGSRPPAKRPSAPAASGPAAGPAGRGAPLVSDRPQPTERVVAPQAFEDLDPNSFLLDRPHAETPIAEPTVFDWIADAPDAVWYVRNRAGGQYGPAVGSVMRTWLHEGRVSANCFVWREGWAHWRQAVDVFPHLFQPTPFPAMAPAAATLPPRATEPAIRATWAGPGLAGDAPTAAAELLPSHRRRHSTALFVAILLFVLTLSGVAITTIVYFLKLSNEVQTPDTRGDQVPEIRDPFAK